MPTDALTQVRDVMREAFATGLPKLREQQMALGRAVHVDARGVARTTGQQVVVVGAGRTVARIGMAQLGGDVEAGQREVDSELGAADARLVDVVGQEDLRIVGDQLVHLVLVDVERPVPRIRVPRDAQVDALAGGRVQLEHHRHRGVTQGDARLHQATQLQQADPEPVDARVGAINETALGHGAEDAVCGRRVKPGLQCELLQGYRIGMLCEHIEQLHHAINDLNGVLAFGNGSRVDLLGRHVRFEMSRKWGE